MSDSIRDDIEAALKEQDEREPEGQIEQEEELDEEVEVPEPEKNEPEKPDEPEVKEPEAAKPEEPEGTWSPEKAPTSWSPKVREQWGKLPEDVRKEIVRREEASVQGVRKLQEEFQPVRQFAERLTPVIQEARALGQDPSQYVINLAVAERNLRSQDPNEKFNALLNIADQYGIPLRQYLGGEQAPAQSAPAIPAAVQQELQAMRQWREQEQAQQLQNQIEEFSKGAEFFEDVRNDMAVLLESGAAKDLKEAYDKAVWINPEVREVMLAREAEGKKKAAANQRRAKASSVSVEGADNKPGVEVDLPDDDDSTAAIIREQFKAASSGRV